VFPVNSRYYHNITSNTLGLLEAMVKYDVKTLIYSSTCATYGEPETMPITETTPQVPINPYGKAKKMAEDIILDYSKINPELSVMILRYFNVIGSDPKGRLGEVPRPELRAHGRISGACFDAAMGQIPGLKVLLLQQFLNSYLASHFQLVPEYWSASLFSHRDSAMAVHKDEVMPKCSVLQ
jgi:UDP-glucose 4-epimerase